MSGIQFEAKIIKVGTWTLIRLPKQASAKLPSRGMVMVAGNLNGVRFQTALEPDGKGGHWFRVDNIKIGAKAGEMVKLEIENMKDWPEPDIPLDLKEALKAFPKVQTVWMEITPMARWDWIRWISSTKNPETRKHRIEVTVSKFRNGKRRPCCFNRTMCTDPYISKNGVLLED